MLRAMCIAGARPNFMKIKPVIDALTAKGADVRLVHTGQHYDPLLSDVFFDDLGLRAPDCSLDVGSGSHAEQTARVMMSFEPVVRQWAPDVVVVVGDVNSTVACALVAAKLGARVAHVEAGLRSRDWSMPEEVNRVVVDRLSDHLFAPSGDAVENLRAEGYRADQVHLVGNVMVDTLLANSERAAKRQILDNLGLSGTYGLLTLHRPANVDEPQMLARLLDAVTVIGGHCPIIFPAHPRTAGMLSRNTMASSIRVIEPLGYLDFLCLQQNAALVLTDSGGVQEETTALGVPCLTLRESTERPITVSEGTNEVVGTDPERIVARALSVLANPPAPRCPSLWDGRAGDRIADVLTSPRTFRTARPTALPTTSE